MTFLAALLTLALIPQVEPQDKSRVPEDSVELTVVGCLKGRAFTSVPPACPAPGWTTSPAGLSITSSESSSWTPGTRMSSPGGALALHRLPVR